MVTKDLKFQPVHERPELVSLSVALRAFEIPALDVLVAEIDPAFMGGEELCEHYGLDRAAAANCVVVEASHGDVLEHVAIILPVGHRADLNGFVRKHLKAKRVSLAKLDHVLAQTGMEYGSITPFGLPIGWKIMVDESLMQNQRIIVGGGKQVSKLSLPREAFLQFGTEIIRGLAI